jgi:hypothetical protein
MSAKTKTCSVCKKRKRIKEFESKTRITGTVSYRSSCRVCCRKKRNIKTTSDPHKFLAIIFTQLKSTRKHKRPDLEWEIVLDDVIDLWEKQEGFCALSGLLMTHTKDGEGKKDLNVSLDRINPNEGYKPGNIQLVAYRVNIMKHSLSEDLFLWWCENIVNQKIKKQSQVF